MQDSMTVTSTMTISAGTLNTNTNFPISVGGSWWNTNGLFLVNGSTVTFLSNATHQRIKSRGFPFKGVDLGQSGGNGYWTLIDSMTVSTVTIASQNGFELAGLGLSISSFTNAGSFVLQSLEGVKSAPLNLAGSSVTYNATSGAPLVFSTWTYRNLIINGSGATFTVVGGSVTVNENLTLTAGTFDSSASNFTIGVAENWLNSGGLFNARASTVTFTGALTGNTITSRGSPFGSVSLTGSGYWTLIDSMTLTSTMTVTNGTLDTSASNCSGLSCNMTVAGSWYETNGTFLTNASTIAFTAATAQKIQTGGDPFNNIQFNNAAGSWVMQDSMTVTSTMTISAGTLNTNVNSPISVGGSWWNTNGSFTVNGSTVTFMSNAAHQRIKSRGFPFKGVDLGQLGGNGYWTLIDSMTVSTVTIASQNGFELAGLGLSISSFTNAGSFVLQSLEGVKSAPLNLAGSSVTFNATSGSPLIFSTWTYRNLVINGAGATFTLVGGSLTVNESLSLWGGTFDPSSNNYLIGIGQNWYNTAGSYTQRASTVTFTGSSAGNGIQSGGDPFASVWINGSGGWTLIDSMTVTSTMTLANGTLGTSASNCGGLSCNMTVGGSWYETNGSFLTNTSTIAFTGATPLKIQTGGDPFYNVQFNNASGSWVMQDSMTVAANMVFTAGAFNSNAVSNFGISVANDWRSVGGTTALNQSTVTLTGTGTANLLGSTTFYSLTCTVPNKTLTLQINSTQTVSNVLTLTGTSGNLIQVNSSASGTSAYVRNLGSNAVSFVNATDNDAIAGITIQAGTNSTGTRTVNWLFGAPTLSVTFAPKAYDFQSVSMAATTLSTYAIVITNAGDATETFSLSVATTGAQTVWAVGTAPPTTQDTFVLYGLFNPVEPVVASFATNDIMISTPTAATSSVFSTGASSGVSTPIGSANNFWLRLDMPPTTSTAAQQQMTVTVSASYP